MEFPNKAVGQGPEPPPPKEKITPVVSGAKIVKRPASKRFANFFFAESPKALSAKIGKDVIVPRLKLAFEEACNSFLGGMLWGDISNRPMSGLVQKATLRGHSTPYGTMSTIRASQSQQIAHEAVVTRSSGNYEDVVLPSVKECEILLANMVDRLNQYNVVTVGDLYEFAEIMPTISDNAYGWYSLDGARISHIRGAYMLELPRPVLL